jgi:hypothetical protein
MEIEVETIEYQHGKHILNRKRYKTLPESIRAGIGDVITQLDQNDTEEFKVLEINGNEVICESLVLPLKRYFYADSIRKSEWQIKRDKKAVAFKKKQELWKAKEEKQKRRAEKLLLKLEREEAKKNRKLKHKKVKKVTIKFI